MTTDRTTPPSGNLPSLYDQRLDELKNFPGVLRTKPTIIRLLPGALGVGGSQIFIVQTFRQKEIGDTIFVDVVGAEGRDGESRTVRLVFPPKVANALAGQRDALTAKARRRGAQQGVETRERLGIVSGFLKSRRRKKPKESARSAASAAGNAPRSDDRQAANPNPRGDAR